MSLYKQTCKSCETVFTNKTWVDCCPICRGKDFDVEVEQPTHWAFVSKDGIVQYDTLLTQLEMNQPAMVTQAMAVARKHKDWAEDESTFTDVSRNDAVKTRLRIIEEYGVKDGKVQDPGKFEGEAIYIPYYFEQAMNGGGGDEQGYSKCNCEPDEDCDCDLTLEWERFDVSYDEREIFPELDNVESVTLEYRSDGFVIGRAKEKE